MTDNTTQALEEAIEVLQQLGLKEYEARCFVGLTRIERAPAKKLSEITEVPRTRVYDAVRVLEAKGLVEIQHSSPQQLRAVPVDEAIETLRDQCEARHGRLRDALDTVEVIEDDDQEPVQEVWTMAGQEAIENRTEQLIDTATEEIVLVLGVESLLTQDLVATLNDVSSDVDLLIGTVTESLQYDIQTVVPDATTFVSGLEWLSGPHAAGDGIHVGRLLLTDRSTILASSIMPVKQEEHAIFGKGFGNCLVVIARRLMAQGLIPTRHRAVIIPE